MYLSNRNGGIITGFRSICLLQSIGPSALKQQLLIEVGSREQCNFFHGERQSSLGVFIVSFFSIYFSLLQLSGLLIGSYDHYSTCYVIQLLLQASGAIWAGPSQTATFMPFWIYNIQVCKRSDMKKHC